MNRNDWLLFCLGTVLGGAFFVSMYEIMGVAAALSGRDILTPTTASFIGALTSGIVGATAVVLAVFLTYSKQKRRDAEINQEKKAHIILALYAELYLRAARAVRDCATWRGYIETSEKIDLSRFRKFRPDEPFVYQSLGSDIGMLPIDIVSHLNEFYFRLDAVRRDVEKTPNTYKEHFDDVDPYNLDVLFYSEMKLFHKRLRQTLGPAIRAISILNHHAPDDYENFDNHLGYAHEEFLGAKNNDIVDLLESELQK